MKRPSVMKSILGKTRMGKDVRTMDQGYQSQGRLEKLKKRVQRCVCKYCGGELRLRRIIFSDYEEARVEIFCTHCDRIEYGVEPMIYQNARYFVEELGFQCYPELDDNDQTREMTVAKVCEIMMWGDQRLGLLDENGFKVPVTSAPTTIYGLYDLLTDQDLDGGETSDV